jgi:hypothetical protein
MATKPNLGDEIQSLVTGLQTALPVGTQSLTVGAVVYDIPRLIQLLQTYRSDWTVAEDSGAKHHADVQRRNEKEPAARDFVTELKPAIIAAVGSKNPDLAKFGLKPRQPRKKLTGEEQVAANAAKLSTRKARNTMGPRQKAKIHGVTPAASGAAQPGQASPPPAK